MEKLPIQRQIERVDLIQSRVASDADKYVELMRIKSPQSLELAPDGTIVINAFEGSDAFHNTIVDLKLNTHEVKKYMEDLATEVKKILYGKEK